MLRMTLDDLFQNRAGQRLSRDSVAAPHFAVQPPWRLSSSGPENVVF